MQACGFVLALGAVASASAQPLKRDPTPQDYVERNGGDATIVPAGQLVLDGHRMTCGSFPTVLDPNLNDYAAAPYRQFIILNMPDVAKVPTVVKLWIYSHECGHKFVGSMRTRLTALLYIAAGLPAGSRRGVSIKCAASSALRVPMRPI